MTQKNVFNSACQINCLSENKLFAMPIILDDAHSSVIGKVWIPFGIDINDLKLQVIKDNTGDITINNIHIQENMPYRYIRLAGFAILFVLIDFLFGFLKTKVFSKSIKVYHGWL